MKVGEKKYYKIIKSLGKLKGCQINEKDVIKSEFGIKLILTDDSGSKYSRYEYQIELSYKGSYNDIIIGKNTYSYIVKYSDYYHNKKFNIEYSNGKEIRTFQYESQAKIMEDRLCEVIYILILLSEIDDIDKTLLVYQFIFNLSFKPKTLGVRIDLYKEIKELCTNLKGKYPFIYYHINIGLEERLEEIKKDLVQEGLAENGLL